MMRVLKPEINIISVHKEML